MAMTQEPLIGWQAVEESGDLGILRRVLAHLGDEELMEALERRRAGRRDRYPVRAVWNTFVAAVVLGHETMTAFLRELRRNAELRQVLGYDPMLGSEAVPRGYVLSRLLARLEEHEELVAGIFRGLVARLFNELPEDFGRDLAADGKAIKSRMRKDLEAGLGTKKSTDADEEVLYQWFGYKVHCLSDTRTELPIAFRVSPPDRGESPELLPLLEEAMEDHPQLCKRAETLAADKGYDDGEDKLVLHREHGIAPVIPARDLFRGEYKPLEEKVHDTVYTSPSGEIACRIAPFRRGQEKQFCSMQFQGFEADRGTLKFRCPAAAFGVECQNKEACRSAIKDRGHGRVVRVKIEDNPRLFTPIYAHSQRFARLYKGRTSIERLFSRLDNMFGMEAPLRTTGLARATIRVTIAMSAMVATALGWLAEERPGMIRRRLQSAAA